MDKIPSIVMKVGVYAALVEGKKTSIDAPPVQKNGKTLIPFGLLPEYATAPTLRIGDTLYQDASKVEGAFVKVDSMGLIFIDRESWVTELSHEKNLPYMLTLASLFIYDLDRVNIKSYDPATDEERAAFKKQGEAMYRMLLEKSGKHPYLFANEERFARLREILAEGKDDRMTAALCNLAEAGERIIAEDRYRLNEEGTDLAAPITNPYADGYDEGGRLGAANSHSTNMRSLAFSYLMTGKELYARVAYYIGVHISRWEHWGPGHFLNTSTTVMDYAIAYDWLYNAWESMKLDTGVIRRAIFELGIIDGYNSAICDKCDHPSPRQGTGWRFKAKSDNWNAVCNSGLIVANLAYLGEGRDSGTDTESFEKAKELLGLNLISLTSDGLVMKQYAPDGSYVESNSYWTYGTNMLLHGMGALHSALGTDFGIHHAPGFDRTCYYAINSESAEYVGWNYHDGSLSGQDTSMFNMLAYINGDSMLYALRRSHVEHEHGKRIGLFDLLYHPVVVGREIPSLSAMPLDYYMEGIDALTVRSGWERGSLYAGIIGGYNPKGGSHNQVDSGAFVYHNKGILWLTDLGADNYNIKGGYFGNYALYRRNGEGANNLILKSLPYGQRLDATGRICRINTEADTPFAVIDQTEIYGAPALRGMLLTNGRQTLVIQDEMKLSAPDTAYWIAHYPSDKITAEISEDGTRAILTHESGEQIKLTVAEGRGKFRVGDCYDFLLSGTASFEGEHSRDGFRRLIVELNEVTNLALAVVIEPVDCNGYEKLTPMSEW